MSSFKKIGHATLAFVYMCCAISPVMADDSEIYMGGNSGTTGNPNVLMLIDTSGSMAYDMASNSSSGIALENQRMTHLKTAVTKILSSLPGNIRVGLARYNSDGYGGRIIYPLTQLDSIAGADPVTGNISVTGAISASTDDVEQSTYTNGATLVSNGASLTVGGTPDSTFSMAANADAAVQCNTGTTPAIYIGGAGSSTDTTIKKGLYLGNHPLKVSSVFCESSLGLRFTNLAIPSGAVISSAKLVFTHAGSPDTAPSGTTWGPDSGAALSLQASVENSLTPVTYSTTNTITSRSFLTTPVTNISLTEDSFAASNDSLSVDVTALVKDRKTAAGASALNTVNFRIKSSSGSGSSQTVNTTCATRKKGVCIAWNTATVDSPLIRRIYGYQDDTTKAPKLLVTYAATGTSGRTVGLRFQGVTIPQNSTIVSAKLELTAAGDSANDTSTIQINSDATSTTYINSLAFSSTNHLGSSRWGSYNVKPSTGQWVKDTTYSLDIKSLLQNQVNLSNYCSGALDAGNQSLGLLLQLDSGTARSAYSLDGNSDKPPRLVITYLPPSSGSTCVQASRMSSASSTVGNYATQISTTSSNVLGGNVSSATAIQLANTTFGSTGCSANCAAIRFPAIDVPKDAVISKVTLSLVAANTTSGTMTVKGISTGDAATYTTTAKLSSMALYSNSATFSISGTSSGKRYELSNSGLAAVIQSIVSNSAWARGNSLGLMLGNNANSGPTFYTNYSSSRYPQLTITYKSSDVADAQSTAREVLIETVNALTANGGTPLNGSYYETALYMLGQTANFGRAYTPLANASYSLHTDSAPAMNTSNLYQSPVAEASCQSNNIVALTDGVPTNDQLVNKGTGACTDPFVCMASTADYLYKTGRNSYPINTYTIGFGPVVGTTNADGTVNLSDAGLSLKAVASAGGGEFFPATDSDALVTSFQTIFARIADSNGTMAAPGVAVSQLNRSEHLDQLYYGVFKPKTQKRWPGNLKRYKLLGNDIVDQTDTDAIDPTTKYFRAAARSFWSSAADGNEATEGGAAEKQTAALTVYTDSGAAGAMTVLDAANPPAAMGAGSTASPNKNVQWIQGIDVDNENANGSGFRQAMGSPIHPQPTLVSYGSSNESFAVFVSTNDGLLHSINNSDGTSNWAWLPQEMQSRIPALRASDSMAVGDVPLYGLDASWSVVTLAYGSNKGDRLLVGGMRQGGQNYYAVTLPTTKTGAPRLRWKLTGSDLDGAKTWSQPVYGRVRVSTGSTGTIKDVVVVGGGLDDSVYEAGSTITSPGGDAGNAVYILDADTGAKLATIATSAMRYSIPASPRLVDKDGDSLIDHIYFGDTGGQIFRVDLNNVTGASALVKGTARLATLGISEAAGKANDRRFYETPAVAYVKDSGGIYAAVAIGSGDRNFPASNRSTQDRLYVIKDYDAGQFGIATTSKDFTHSSLDNLTSSSTLTSGKFGWYINLPATGEKVLSAPFIFSRQTTASDGTKSLVHEVYFNSFRPDATSASSCSPVQGSTYAWTVNLFNATAGKDRNASGSVDSSDRATSDSVVNGISGSDVGLIRDGQLKRVTGTDAEDAGKVPDGFNQIQRTRWFDNPNVTK